MTGARFTLRRQRITYPLWVRHALVLVVAAFVPIVLVTGVYLANSIEERFDILASRVEEVGQRQRQTVALNIARAQESLLTFAETTDVNRAFTSLLLSNVVTNPPLPRTLPTDVQQILSSNLLNPATTFYNGARLVAPNGVVMAAAGTNVPVLGTLQSTNVSFLAGLDAPLGETRFIVTRRAGDVTLEVAVPVTLRNTPTRAGVLVGTLNPNLVALDALRTSGALSLVSYLLSDNDILLAPDAAQASLSAQASIGVAQARDGLAGAYLDERGNTEPIDGVVGYSGPVLGAPFVLVTEVSASVIENPLVLWGASGFSLIVGGSAIATVVLGYILSGGVVPALGRLRAVAQNAALGNFDEPLPDAARPDEVGEAARALLLMRDTLRRRLDDAEERLTQRGQALSTARDLGQTTAQQPNLQDLMNSAVALLVERVPSIYHAQVFLLDAERRYAVLRASTGTAGRTLLARGHRLAVGSVSVIGQVTARTEQVLVRDVQASDVHRANEFLPETRTELALPLRVGGRVVGALDVQSRQADAFDADLIETLELIAGQLAPSIEAARLAADNAQRQRATDLDGRRATSAQWRDYLYDRRARTLSAEAGAISALDAESLAAQATQQRRAVTGALSARGTIPVALPILLRDQVLGTIVWEVRAADFDPARLQLAQALADRLALSLENARLFEQSQRATERERLVNDIAGKLATQNDINEILRTAVREVGQALRAPQVSIQLINNADADPNTSAAD